MSRTNYVGDAGFNSKPNRRILLGASDHCIIGKKLQPIPIPRLGQKGKFTKLENGLKIKDILVDAESIACRRFILISNSDKAKQGKTQARQYHCRGRAQDHHIKWVCELHSHAVFCKYIKQIKTGKLSIDRMKIRKEEQFAGKYMISTSDLKLLAEELVMIHIAEKLFTTVHFATLKTHRGIVQQTNKVTPELKKSFNALQVDISNKVLHVEI